MVPVYSDAEFDEQTISCPECGWTGKGHQSNIVDLYGVAAQKEVHCPDCDQVIASLKKRDDPPGESATDLSFQLG
jgi:hypothetical protein